MCTILQPVIPGENKQYMHPTGVCVFDENLVNNVHNVSSYSNIYNYACGISSIGFIY